MAKNSLRDAFKSAVNSAPMAQPWSFLDKQIPYEDSKHRHALRPGTMASQKTVKLYLPILKAAWLYAEAEPLISNNLPFRLVKKSAISSNGPEPQYIVEMGLPDSTCLVVTATSKVVRVTHVETDGTRNPIMPFRNESADTLTAIMLAILPHILELDQKEGGGKLLDAINTIGQAIDVNTWADKNDIPEIIQDAFYFTDVVVPILTHKLDMEFNSNTSANVAEEVDASCFNAPSGLSGELICEFLVDGWTPKYVDANGTAAKIASKNLTIGEAKKKYASYSAHRNWTPQERILIQKYPDDMPVMPETLLLADAIINTTNDVNPIRNAMWRGVTSYGKSTGIKQLSCILNIPLLIITCFPDMEVADFKSTYVPAGTTEGIMLDMSRVVMAAKEQNGEQKRHRLFDDAIAHLNSLPKEQAEQLMDAPKFFMTAAMDVDMACEMLLGRNENLDFDELCPLYLDVHVEMETSPLREQISRLEAAGNTEEAPKAEEPKFIHVVSNYVKALINGYLIEVQEPSRIRESGVLVGLIEYDRPGAVIDLMNGGSGIRHKDALCIFTDNVGYDSCKPLDPSVLRRMGLIIDSYDLPREMVIDRVKRNTGCTDAGLLDLAYNLWNCVKEFCEHNAIVEGSVSPTELERFVQIVTWSGPDSIVSALNNCIISKASSSPDDQREIRTACATIYSAVAA